jgi:hypothetical protein
MFTGIARICSVWGEPLEGEMSAVTIVGLAMAALAVFAALSPCIERARVNRVKLKAH